MREGKFYLSSEYVEWIRVTENRETKFVIGDPLSMTLQLDYVDREWRVWMEQYNLGGWIPMRFLLPEPIIETEIE